MFAKLGMTTDHLLRKVNVVSVVFCAPPRWLPTEYMKLSEEIKKVYMRLIWLKGAYTLLQIGKGEKEWAKTCIYVHPSD